MRTARTCSGLVVHCAVAAAAALCLAVTATAHGQSFAPHLQGLAPDAQVVGGLGLGLGGGMDNPFSGRGRIGLLYAYEPWIGAIGPSLELGALAGVGFGGEVEINHFDGWFTDLGLARASGASWLTHAAVGFMVFGLEWQHRFDTRDADALMFQVRLPLGTWWFFDRKREDQDKQRRATATAARRDAPFAPREPAAAPAPSTVPVPPEQQGPDGNSAGAVPSPSPGPATSLGGQLRVVVDGDTHEMTAELDGQEVPQVLLGYDVPVAAGAHELVLRRYGGVVARQRFSVEAGKLVRVTPQPLTPAAP